MQIDELENMLIAWSEDDTEYQAEIKKIDKLWHKAHIDSPGFNIYKKEYLVKKERALVRLMHRLSILGEMSVIPNREEMTRL